MLTVLFIDDQVESLKPLLTMVKRLLNDVEIITESSGTAGLERARTDKPDMIFLDISMPDIDGYTVCRKLQESTITQAIPVLFLSSLELSMKEQLDALEIGAVDFLRKPIQSVELATRIRVMARLNDYTHRLEELVEEQTKRIERHQTIASRTERLAAMGTLAAGIAHEINQPLNALKVTADGLLYWKEREESISEEEVFDGLRFISKQCARIEAIINNMRDLVQQNPVTSLEAIDIHQPIEQALSLIGQQLRQHSIEVERQFDSNLPMATGSMTPVEQIILNLLNNSLNALDRTEKLQKKVIIRTVSDEEWVTIEVCDNGPGIPEEQLEQVFDPFFSDADSVGGMGLGLSITQNLVVSLKGTLSVRNLDGGGACFSVSLPRVKS